MSSVQDGLVFVEFNYQNGGKEYINVANITRIKQLNEKDCKRMDLAYPGCIISLVGTEKDLQIGNITADDFKRRIQDAIDKHYDSIAEKFLLGKQ